MLIKAMVSGSMKNFYFICEIVVSQTSKSEVFLVISLLCDAVEGLLRSFLNSYVFQDNYFKLDHKRCIFLFSFSLMIILRCGQPKYRDILNHLYDLQGLKQQHISFFLFLSDFVILQIDDWAGCHNQHNSFNNAKRLKPTNALIFFFLPIINHVSNLLMFFLQTVFLHFFRTNKQKYEQSCLTYVYWNHSYT